MKIAYFRFKYTFGNSCDLIGYFSYEFTLNNQDPLNKDFLYKELENYMIKQHYKLIEILSFGIY